MDEKLDKKPKFWPIFELATSRTKLKDGPKLKNIPTVIVIL